jgi:hypothetical protein
MLGGVGFRLIAEEAASNQNAHNHGYRSHAGSSYRVDDPQVFLDSGEDLEQRGPQP